MANYDNIIAACGLDFGPDDQGPGLVADRAIPCDEAARLVAKLECAGAEASCAPDHEDRSTAWLYVVPPVEA